MDRLIGDDASIEWIPAPLPRKAVVIKGEPLFRVRSVSYGVEGFATVVLENAFCSVTAEGVSIEVCSWLRNQSPYLHVTLSQLYNPPGQGVTTSLPLTEELLDGYLSTDELAAAAFKAGMSQAEFIRLLLSDRAGLLECLRKALTEKPPAVVFRFPLPEGGE